MQSNPRERAIELDDAERAVRLVDFVGSSVGLLAHTSCGDCGGHFESDWILGSGVGVGAGGNARGGLGAAPLAGGFFPAVAGHSDFNVAEGSVFSAKAGVSVSSLRV